YAQVETNGQLSVMLNTSDEPVTPKIMSLSPTPQNPFFVIISDGYLLKSNLSAAQKTEKWLHSVAKSNGADNYSDIFLLCADINGNVIFSKKEQRL
ncbi:MAG: DUF421 domain-containing protein, partial [Angelakisella sp.]